MAASSSATLRTVDRSQPKLVHSTSQLSLEAADEYYSFSNSSHQSRHTVLPYRTPPSRNLSPASTIQQAPPPPTQPSANMARNASQQNTQANPHERQSETDTPSPGVDDTPYIRFAIDQLTRDEEVTGSGRQGSVVSIDYPVERILPEEVRNSFPSSLGDDCTSSHKRDSLVPDFLIPVDPSGEDDSHASLDYTPLSLRPIPLGAFIVVCLAMMAALVFCNVWSQRHDGLWAYDKFGGVRYFVVQFLPQILAAVIIMWTWVVQAAVYRIAPLSLISRPDPKPCVLQHLSMLPRNFLLPDMSHFRYGDGMIGLSLFIIWLANFLAIPLQSGLFQVQWFGTAADGQFKWTSVQGIAWTLFALYALLSAALIAILVRFGWGTSGLLWDPVSIADLIPLIQRSNILNEFHRSEVSLNVERHITLRGARLGYWRDSEKPDLIYGIAKEGTASEHITTRDSQGPSRDSNPPADVDVEKQCLNSKGSFEKTIYSPFSRYRWAPWFLRDTFVVTWFVIVSVLTITFIVVSFVRRPLEKGFRPLLPTLPSSGGFSSSNFLYSFLPSLIGTFFFLAWQPIDVYFRSTQSFAELSAPEGAIAERSLLLSYGSGLPFETTIRALIARHYKVAYISFIGMACAVLPVLAGGVFLAHDYGDEIRISTYLPAYYTLIAFVIICAMSYFVIWPRRKRYLPHSLATYADVISFLYQSPLLSDEVLREPRTKEDLVTRVTVAPLGEAETMKYAFGLYRGRDGREHLGIDRLTRPGRLDMLVPSSHS